MEAFIAVRADIRQTCRLLSLIRAFPFVPYPSIPRPACLFLPLASGTMLHMTPESMTGIHVTLFGLVTMTDKMFSSSYITASTDVIGLAGVTELLL